MILALNHLTVFPSAIVQRTGPHEVGTLPMRLRIAGGSGRSLAVRLWYPADGPPTAVSWLLTLFSRLRHPTWAPARYGARLPSAQSVFPLITYVPDAPRGRQDNTYTLANLASHGFILAAIQNPFANGSRREEKLLGEGSERVPSLADHRIRSGVIAASELLDALDELKSNSPAGAWAGRFDLKRAGILGYALGGTVAAATSAVDGRYAVAGSLDGAPADDHLVKVPYLLMRSDPAAKDAASDASGGDRDSEAKPTTARPEGHTARTQASLPTSHIIEIAGARREHFSDRLVTSVTFARGAQRSVGMRVRAIIDAYTVAFFQTYLGVSPHPLMCVRHSPYPEVRFVDGSEPDAAFRLVNPSEAH